MTNSKAVSDRSRLTIVNAMTLRNHRKVKTPPIGPEAALWLPKYRPGIRPVRKIKRIDSGSNMGKLS